MLMRPLNGANAELTGRVSRAAARGVMAAVSAGNYTLSRCILAALSGERGAPSPPLGAPPGAPPPTAGLTARDTRLRPPRPPHSSPSQKQGPGGQPPMHTLCTTAHTQSHALQLHHCAPCSLSTHPSCAQHTVLTHYAPHPPTLHTLGTHKDPRTHLRGTHVRVHTNTSSNSAHMFSAHCASGLFSLILPTLLSWEVESHFMRQTLSFGR